MRRLVLLMTLAGALASAVPAGAGTYVVHSCRTPDGKAAPAEGWKPVLNGGQVAASNNCAGGGNLHAHAFGGAARGNYFSWQFEAPERTTIVNYAIDRLVHNVSSPCDQQCWAWNYTFFENEVAFNVGNDREACWASSGCFDVDGTFGQVARSTRRLIAFTDCSSGQNDCAAGGASLTIRKAQITLEEKDDPGFSGAPAGNGFESPASGTRQISFTAADPTSGVARVWLEVDGKSVAESSVACAPPYTALMPCKTQVNGTLLWDTTKVSDGSHNLRLLVADAAGNMGAYGPISVTVRNQAAGAPPACETGQGTVTLAFGRATRKTVSFGRTVTVNGRALQANGAPTAGQPVEIRTSQGGVAPITVTTKPDGTFSARVGTGPNRTLTAGSGRACSKPISLRVRAAARLRVADRSVRNGQAARFSGTVISTPVPARKLVLLQGRSPRTGRWTTLKTVRTGARNRFRATYRFRRTFRRTTFRFRVFVPAESGFSYASGVSKTVRVTVRP